MAGLIPLVDLLADKKGDLKEAHLILFEYCNLRCSFCHQDHSSKVGMSADAMWDKVDALFESTDPRHPYVINITGGELFLDEFPDDYFDVYYGIGRRILEHYDDATVVLGTNLIYRGVDRVVKLVENLKVHGKVKIATSYDPAGRFDRDSYPLFMQNLSTVREYVDTVNVVITKQNIETILAGKETTPLTWLCDNFSVYFDHYIPSANYERLQPSEDLIGKLYLYLNEHHPNSYPLISWKENQENITTCRSTKIINKDGAVTTCWSEAGKDAVLDEQAGLQAKNAAEERFLDHYGCFSCEYYQRCGLRCFLHHSFVEGSAGTCQIKAMFDQIL